VALPSNENETWRGQKRLGKATTKKDALPSPSPPASEGGSRPNKFLERKGRERPQRPGVLWKKKQEIGNFRKAKRSTA